MNMQILNEIWIAFIILEGLRDKDLILYLLYGQKDLVTGNNIGNSLAC